MSAPDSSTLDFPSWLAQRPAGRFTDWLRERNQNTWEEVINHRFTQELATGTLDDSVFRRYLIQDYTFLNTFVKLLGFAIGAAPALE